MDKDHLLDHVQQARDSYLDAMIAFHRAEKAVGDQSPEDAVPHLQETSDNLENVIEQIEIALDVATQVVETDGSGGDDDQSDESEEQPPELDEEEIKRERRAVLQRLREQANASGYFYDDPELWNYLEASALAEEPFAGYAMFAEMATRFRNRIDGLIRDIERGCEFHHVEQQLWKATRIHLRVTNLGVMVSYINRETQGA